MRFIAEFRPKKKAKKENPALYTLALEQEAPDKKTAKAKAEQEMRQAGQHLSDYFAAKVTEGTIPGEEKQEAEPEEIATDTGEGAAVATVPEETPTEQPPTIGETQEDDAESIAELDEDAKLLAGITEDVLTMPPGGRLWMYDIPDHVYHQTPGIGSTAARELMKSPAHYKAYVEKEKVTSCSLQKTFDQGDAAHRAVLQPYLFDGDFAVLPEGINMTMKAGKAFAEENTGKTVLSFKVGQEVTALAVSVLKNKAAHFMLRGDAHEVSVWYHEPETGLILKARLDVDHEDFNTSVDFKTTRDASPAKFAKSVKYDYSVQSALYKLVTGRADFLFVGAEKVPPYAVSLARVPADYEQLTKLRLMQRFHLLKQCKIDNEYPCYDTSEINEADVYTSELDELNRLQGEI